MKEILSQYELGAAAVRYYIDTDTKNVGLVLLPEGRAPEKIPVKNCSIEPLVQIKIAGDDYPNGFAHGHTMRNSVSTARFQFEKQHIVDKGDSKTIVTVLKNDRSLTIEHHLISYSGYSALECFCIFINHGSDDVYLEMLSSFSMGEITPFEPDDASGVLILHRLRSVWSAEGRLESIPVEDLQLEPSWSGYGTRCERYGQIGSMPVRKHFPYAVIEDTKNNVSWGTQIACPSSWQIEVSRRDDALCISGGIADREFGHWLKKIAPGETFMTCKAILSVSEGGVDQVSQKMTDLHSRTLSTQPSVEAGLPIIFNEFCTTWGNPTQDNICGIADTLKGRGIKYFVIDCGWYKQEGRNWDSSMGDWKLCEELFPNGLKKTLDTIRECGMIPGIWFEFEICGRQSDAFNYTEHLLKRDGHVITTGDRRFWDMSDPYVLEYLTDKVIRFLKKYQFGYLKIDYNDTIGIGCDGAESLGEGLRQRVLATQQFIREIRNQIPDIVIENCSSGGHRLEPSMLGLTSMSSFSDAHECVEIPVIAANLHRAVLPRQSQIWAVLRKEDEERRLVYSLANTFLGRMCLSGDVFDLSTEQWDIVEDSISFYNKVSPTIRDGFSYRFGPTLKSYRHPEGWQAVLRVRKDKKQALVLVHTFGGVLPDSICIEAPDIGELHIASVFSEKGIKADLKDGCLKVAVTGNFQAMALCLEYI